MIKIEPHKLPLAEKELFALLEGKTVSEFNNSVRFGEIPRKVIINGKWWTWRHVWQRTMKEEARLLHEQGYQTQVCAIKQQRFLYFRSNN